jgi:hypothetical protein
VGLGEAEVDMLRSGRAPSASSTPLHALSPSSLSSTTDGGRVGTKAVDEGGVRVSGSVRDIGGSNVVRKTVERSGPSRYCRCFGPATY